MTHDTEQIPLKKPATQVHDRRFERRVHDCYTELVEAFETQGFTSKEARLWVSAWRHTDKPTDLARTALAFKRLRVPAGQAIPWFWERIPADIASRYLPHRWRAAEARQVMQALRQQNPILTRRQGLHLGLRWAETGRTPAAARASIARGQTQPT